MTRDNENYRKKGTTDSGWKKNLQKALKILPHRIRELLKPVGVYVVIVLVIAALAKFNGMKTGELLSTINILTGLFTTVLAAMTWLNVQMLRRTLPPDPPEGGQGAAIVIIDIGNGNIEGAVFDYCETQDLFKEMLHGSGFRNRQVFDDINSQISGSGYLVNGIGEDRRAIILARAPIENAEDSASQIYQAFGWLEKALRENGISDLHIFYFGPVIIPFYIGELLSNRFNVYIYKYLSAPGKGTYTYSGLMNHLEYMEKE